MIVHRPRLYHPGEGFGPCGAGFPLNGFRHGASRTLFSIEPYASAIPIPIVIDLLNAASFLRIGIGLRGS